MDQTQKKIVYSLLGVLSVLVLALVLVLSFKSHQAHQEEEKAQTPEGQQEQIAQEVPFTDLRYHNGSTTLSFSLNEDGHWIWADDPDFPLDETNIQEIVELISDLKFQQIITDGDTAEAYGFHEPAATLDATRGDGSQLSLVLGRPTVDQNSRYLMMDHDESTTYIIADDLYQKMQRSIYEMCRLPDLPELTPGGISQITISGQVTTELQNDNDLWKSGETDVTEQPLMVQLLDTVSQLHIEGCIDYKPSAEAGELCGFHSPAAVLDLSYQDADGEEQSLSLTIGAVTPQEGDAPADRFVRLNGEAPIYRMDQELLQPILTLAKQGF